MLATARTSYLEFQVPPRIISEIKKPTPCTWTKEQIRPRITGELLCYLPSEGCWRTRRVVIRSGQLLIGSPGEQNPRFALRRLNLTPGPAAHSFALRRTLDTQPLLTFQASNQREFDNWVRTIAIELIRQTPLDAIKYLDIFTLTPPLDHNHNHIKSNEKPLSPPSSPRKSIDEDDDQHTVQVLLKKCQNSDSYVPVKEKLKLFESLCRLGKTKEDVGSTVTCNSKRTRSLHDLSENVQSNKIAVKQICKYFETKNDESKQKYNTIARTNRNCGPVKNLIERKYSMQPTSLKNQRFL